MDNPRKRKTEMDEVPSSSADKDAVTLKSTFAGAAGALMLKPSLSDVPQVVVFVEWWFRSQKPNFEYVGALPK